MNREEREEFAKDSEIISITPSGIKVRNKYQRDINGVRIDIYDVLMAYNVTNPATAHAIKKLLMPGERGAKDKLQDMKEALFSIERAIILEEGN